MPAVSPNLLLATAIVGGACAMIGVFLDTAWHRSVGRDSFFILPHLFIYVGALAIGVSAFAGIAAASLGNASAFGGRVIARGRVRLPAGFSIASLGILTVLAAGPLDAFWHWMWGKDVLIWSVPHLQLHFGAAITAVGLLLAVAGQHGHGVFRRRWLWHFAMLAVLVDLVHRALFVLAHYTMVPETRTPDFYPVLVSLFLPMVFVAAARAIDPWAPPVSALLFLIVSVALNAGLSALDFERYTVTPLVVIPALAITLVYYAAAARADDPRLAIGAGLFFTIVFTATEAAWMLVIVGRPWPVRAILTGLPWSLIAGAGSGWIGWVLGHYLRAMAAHDGTERVFGGARRERRRAIVALALSALGLASTYRPQRFGPPLTAEELQLVALDGVRYPDTVFWIALLDEGWGDSPRVSVRTEGIIEGLPLSIGPAWCAPTEAQLATELVDARFALAVNGTPVDLSRYGLVPVRLRDGRHCGWVAVGSRFQRASMNRFVYTIDVPNRAGDVKQTVAEIRVTFKDP